MIYLRVIFGIMININRYSNVDGTDKPATHRVWQVTFRRYWWSSFMAKKENNPPILRGFSTGGAGKSKALSSPTTSLWLAIIFVAMFFALLSVQKNIKNANEAMEPIETRHSGWIVPAPEEKLDRAPPPNPDYMFNREDEAPIVLEESIELEQDELVIKIRPIEVDIDVTMPDSLRPKPKSVD